MATKTVILDQPSNWESWIFVIKSIAGVNWTYMNPELDTEPAIPIQPQLPTSQSVNPNRASIATLNEQERETYKLLFMEYKEQLAIANRILDSIQKVKDHIVSTVSANNIVYITDATSVYQILVELKKRLSPTDYSRKFEVIRKYNKLKTFSKNQNVEKWLKEWEITYTDAKKLNIPEVVDERPLLDFTHSISAIDASYSSALEFSIQKKLKKSKPLPPLYDLVEDFRNHYRRIESLETTNSHSAFTTLQGEPQEGESQDKSKDNQEKRQRNCLCGLKHEWSNCEHINPEKRSTNWRSSQEIITKINNALTNWEPSKRQWFLDKFKYDSWKENKPRDNRSSRSKSNDSNRSNGSNGSPSNRPTSSNSNKSNPATIGSFATYSLYSTSNMDKYKLYNSWTLDNASDIHVCNDIKHSGFIQTHEAQPNDRLFAGKSSYAIEAFGTVVINVQTPLGTQKMELTNVALAPGFMTNLVSLHLLNRKNAHWNSETPGVITRNSKTLCYLQQVDNHWVFEGKASYNSYGSFITHKSRKPRTATFTGLQMHRVIGHPKLEVIRRPSPEVIRRPRLEVIGRPSPEVIGRPSLEVIGRPSLEVIGRPSSEVIERLSPALPHKAIDTASRNAISDPRIRLLNQRIKAKWVTTTGIVADKVGKDRPAQKPGTRPTIELSRYKR